MQPLQIIDLWLILKRLKAVSYLFCLIEQPRFTGKKKRFDGPLKCYRAIHFRRFQRHIEQQPLIVRYIPQLVQRRTDLILESSLLALTEFDPICALQIRGCDGLLGFYDHERLSKHCGKAEFKRDVGKGARACLVREYCDRKSGPADQTDYALQIVFGSR